MEEWTISEMKVRMAAGQLTSRQLVEDYLERIESLDRSGPALNSVIEVNPEALAIADECDAQRKAGAALGTLHGIPILIKDNIDTADQMMTTAGSLALEGSQPGQDAFLVSQLRRAGAVLLGKTNLSEWANFRSSHSVSGWSSRGGQTRNPYVLDRTPCGSSSGSGAAVAANLCAAAVGTETDGSIVCPSANNSLVGIKPTLGLVSRSGVIPISHSQDTPGPMARCVADAALVLGAMAGVDERDPATAASQEHLQQDYAAFLDPNGLKGSRLGVPRSLYKMHPLVKKLAENCLEILKRNGAELVELPDLGGAEKTGETEVEVLLYEFKADLNAYLSALGPQARVHSLDELIEYNEQHRERIMPFFGQERFLAAQAKGALTDEAYRKALETNHRLAREEGIDAAIKEHRLDAIVAPTNDPAWLVDFISGDHHGTRGCSSEAAVAGYPHITVPAGYVYRLPIGMSFFGTAWSEPVLLRLAYAFEQATKARRPPAFLPSADLSQP